MTVENSDIENLNSDDGGRVPIVWWAGQPDEDCISIVTTTRPAQAPDWSLCPAAHLTGCALVPTTTYAIVAEADGQQSTPAGPSERNRGCAISTP